MFFKNYPRTFYQFGNPNSDFTSIQNISVYVDIIDQIKDNINFYEIYNIQDGERPDTISQDVYGTVKYYWTLYLLNDELRERGWPLTVQQIRQKAIADYPYKVMTTTDIDNLLTFFQIGDTLQGQTSGAQGVVVKRNIDLGQVFYSPIGSNGFQSGELVRDNTDPDAPETIEITSVSEEYNAAHHYENSSGYVDIDPYSGPGASLTEVTYLDRYESENDNLRKIKIIKPGAINQVVKAYNEALRTN